MMMQGLANIRFNSISLSVVVQLGWASGAVSQVLELKGDKYFKYK
jgi:hypothetical protein